MQKIVSAIKRCPLSSIFAIDRFDSRRKTQFISVNSKKGVQGLQAFAFCVVNVNDEHRKPRLKRKFRG